MAVDMYVKFTAADGTKVEAESQDKDLNGKDGWIQVTQWGLSVNQSATGWVGSGSGGGKAKTDNITFKKQCDKASYILIQNCCLGKTFTKVELVIRKATGEGVPKPYIKMLMGQVVITDYKQSGSAGENDVFEEEITVNPRAWTFEYWVQNPDGKVVPAGKASWDFGSNSKDLAAPLSYDSK